MKTTEYRSVWEKRKAEEEKKRDLAIEKARLVAKTLKERYNVKEVILFRVPHMEAGFHVGADGYRLACQRPKKREIL